MEPAVGGHRKLATSHPVPHPSHLCLACEASHSRLQACQDIHGSGRGQLEGEEHEDASDGVLVVQVRCLGAIYGEILDRGGRGKT